MRVELPAGSGGVRGAGHRPARPHCSAACRQRAFRVRRLTERSATALPGQPEALDVEPRDNAEVIRFLARGWSPLEAGPSLAELIEVPAEVAERLREPGGHPGDLPSGRR